MSESSTSIQQALEELRRDVSAITERLARLEQREFVGRSASTTTAARGATTPLPPVSSSVPKSQPASEQIHTEDEPPESFGGKFLGGVAVLCFVVAAGYFLKLAIDSGFLTPHRQIFISTLFGLGLIGGGLSLKHQDRGYSSLLAGAGICVLFLTALCAYRVYSILDGPATVASMVAISGGAIFLYSVFNHHFFLIAAVIGAYCAPALLTASDPLFGARFIYLLALDILFCLMALWSRQRQILPLAAIFALFVAPLLWALSGMRGLQYLSGQIFWFQTLQFALFACSTFLFSLYHRVTLTRGEGWLHALVLFLFFGMQYLQIEGFWAGGAKYFGLVLGGLVLGALIFVARGLRRERIASFGALGGVGLIMIGHSIFLHLLPTVFIPLCGLAVLLTLPQIRAALSSVTDGWFIWTILLFLMGQSYLGVLTGDAGIGTLASVIYGLLFGVAFVFAGLREAALARDGSSEPSDFRRLYYAAGVLQLAAAFARGFDLLGIGGDIQETAANTALALVLMALAYRYLDRSLAQISLVLFAFVAGKFLLFDLANSSGLLRVLSLLVVGALLYAGGLLLRGLERRLSKNTVEGRA